MVGGVIVVLIFAPITVGVIWKAVHDFRRDFGTASSEDLALEEAWRIHDIYTIARDMMIREAGGWYRPTSYE